MLMLCATGRQKVTVSKMIWNSVCCSCETIWRCNSCQSDLYERQKSSSSLWNKDASTNIHRIRSEFWRRLDRRHDHRGLARPLTKGRVRSSRQKIQVQRSWSQEFARSIRLPFSRWFPRQEGHAQRQTFRRQRVQSFDAKGFTLWRGEG